MRRGICYIVGAGDLCARGLMPGPEDLLLAADGGLSALQRLRLRPNAVVGDMDSFTQPVRGIPVLKFPVRKDDTDLALAIRLGGRLGFKRFRLYGVAGGPREDHFLAALQSMAGASARGLHLRLIADRYTIHTVTNGTLLLHTRPQATVSVFSATDTSQGVSLRGLDYQADSLTLHAHNPLGVSNRALFTRAMIGVRKGTLLVWQQV